MTEDKHHDMEIESNYAMIGVLWLLSESNIARPDLRRIVDSCLSCSICIHGS